MRSSHFARDAFTLVEILIVVIIIGILAVAVVPQFTSASDDARDNSTALVAKAMIRKMSVERAQNGVYPTTITSTMFEGDAIPRNPLFASEINPVFSTSTDATKHHPLTKTTSNATVWWYNSGNGIVRALIPAIGTTQDQINHYNKVNATNITALTDE